MKCKDTAFDVHLVGSMRAPAENGVVRAMTDISNTEKRQSVVVKSMDSGARYMGLNPVSSW